MSGNSTGNTPIRARGRAIGGLPEDQIVFEVPPLGRTRFGRPGRKVFEVVQGRLNDVLVIQERFRVTDGADCVEPATGNELVKVYPVRTALSRQIYRNADCVVHIVPPVNDVKPDRAKEIPKAIERFVSELKLKKKGRIVFLYSIDQAKAKAGAKLGFNVSEMIRPSYCKERLGFESGSMRHLD